MSAIGFTAYPGPNEIGRALAEADTDQQMEVLVAFARRLTAQQRQDLYEAVRSGADENESIALMRLARAINERDEGPEIEA